MKFETVKLLRYYRQSLADGSRKGFDAGFVEEQGIALNMKGFPHVSPEALKKLFHDLPPNEDKRPLQICPYKLSRVVEHQSATNKKGVYPFWVPAYLTREGQLQAPDSEWEYPWFLRGVLYPNEHAEEETPTLAKLDAVDDLLSTWSFDRMSWSGYWASALGFFQALVKTGNEAYDISGWIFETETVLGIPEEASRIAVSILKAYDQLGGANFNTLPKTLETLLLGSPVAPIPLEKPEPIFLSAPHYGQMGDRFPLSESQRVSLALFNKTPQHQILAVNGPPGTGKTTLIQSVVADLLVKTFRNNTEEFCEPPLFAGTSANNKAITNILDSFAAVRIPNHELNGWNERWLPGLPALGHYLASQSADKKSEGTAPSYWTTTSSRDAYRDYCAQHSLEECRAYFLKKLQKSLPVLEAPELNLIEAKHWLKTEVDRLCTRIETLQEASRRLFAFQEKQELKEKKFSDWSEHLEDQIRQRNQAAQASAEIIRRHHLKPRRPGFIKRWIERITLGSLAQRLTRLCEDFQQTAWLSDLSQAQDFNEVSAKVCAFNEAVRTQAYTLTEEWTSLRPDYDQVRSYLGDGPAPWVTAVQEKLDVTERFQAFWMAVHGYEAQWLLHRDDEGYENLNTGQAQSESRWKQRALMTPVFVSTFHSLHQFFSFNKKVEGHWNEIPLIDLFDLLIVDEAGQASPEVGVPAFGLAKRAFVVGDVHQLEPIWSIPSAALDLANARRAGLVMTKEDFDAFLESGSSSSQGSLMSLAQRATAVRYPGHWSEAGSLLTEHRRCVPGVIEYCNRYVYRDLLKICRPSEKSEWPALGYCHIPGESRKLKGSRANLLEAQAIALWIRDHKNLLHQRYAGSLGDILAVITPFRSQIELIYEALKQNRVDIKNLVVGTVHSLQGAEKPVIIFSPVYGRNYSGPMFFNQGYNLLNVAVSRAKDHFFVFGHVTHFRSSASSTPASDLGRLLFRDSSQELENSFIFSEPAFEFFEDQTVDRIADLKTHRGALTKAFKMAEQRIVVVSPFISIKALDEDGILNLIQEARARGVSVLIFTDAHLDTVEGSLKASARIGREGLKAAGADLRVLPGIHNKTLIIDQKVLIEGSFNWLSAVRDASSPFARHETSLVIKAPAAEKFILRAEQELGLNSH